MQRAYLKEVKQPGACLYVTLEGSVTDRPRMEGGGVERSVVVSRFINTWPSQRCERARANASLANTYWRIARLGGQPVGVTSGRREPRLVLGHLDQTRPYTAAVGCNQLTGSYTVTGERIAFSGAAATRMVCPPPLDELERRLGEMLAAARRWRITGPTLELLDEAGASLALFEAVYL